MTSIFSKIIVHQLNKEEIYNNWTPTGIVERHCNKYMKI